MRSEENQTGGHEINTPTQLHLYKTNSEHTESKKEAHRTIYSHSKENKTLVCKF
jgi:hypothetical protein